MHHVRTLSLPSSACLPGTFGQNCNQVCQCSETNQLCHPVSGLCYCAPGFHGPRCDQSTKKQFIFYLLDISYYTEVNKSLLLNLVFDFSLWRGSIWSELWKRVPVWQWREVHSFHWGLWMSSGIYRSSLQHQWVWNSGSNKSFVSMGWRVIWCVCVFCWQQRVQLAATDSTVLRRCCVETAPGTIRSAVAVSAPQDVEDTTVDTASCHNFDVPFILMLPQPAPGYSTLHTNPPAPPSKCQVKSFVLTAFAPTQRITDSFPLTAHVQIKVQ